MNFSHALGSVSLIESERRRLSMSMLVMTASISCPFFRDFARMLDALVPGDVRDVNETVHAVLDLDERAEVRQVTDAAADAVADVEALGQSLPGVRLRLLHAEADAAVLRVNA
jgi:hypothetical protein